MRRTDFGYYWMILFAVPAMAMFAGCGTKEKVSADLQSFCDFIVRAHEPGSGIEPGDRHLGTWRKGEPSAEAVAVWEEYFSTSTSLADARTNRPKTVSERRDILNKIADTRGLNAPGCDAMYAIEEHARIVELIVNPLELVCVQYNAQRSKLEKASEADQVSFGDSFQAVAAAWKDDVVWHAQIRSLIAKLAAMPAAERAAKLKPEFEAYLGIHAMPEECKTLLSDMEKSLEPAP